MKVTIIGSNGLLSSEFGIYCNENNISIDTFGLGSPRSHNSNKFVKLDLLNDKIDFNELAKSDLIIYASGAGIQSNLEETYNEIYSLNTLIPITISKELTKLSFKGSLVTFGSYFEIGNNSNEILFSEIELFNSMQSVPNDYCISKRLLTRYINSSSQSFKHIHLILPTIYGEREGKHRLIPYTIIKIKQKEIPQFTNGNQIRQYLYVGDVPKIIMALVEQKKSGIYNIPGKEVYSIKKVVENIYEYYGFKINDELFGTTQRVDLGMQNLQLNGSLIDSVLPEFKYSKFHEILNKYDKCL